MLWSSSTSKSYQVVFLGAFFVLEYACGARVPVRTQAQLRRARLQRAGRGGGLRSRLRRRRAVGRPGVRGGGQQGGKARHILRLAQPEGWPLCEVTCMRHVAVRMIACPRDRTIREINDVRNLACSSSALRCRRGSLSGEPLRPPLPLLVDAIGSLWQIYGSFRSSMYDA